MARSAPPFHWHSFQSRTGLARLLLTGCVASTGKRKARTDVREKHTTNRKQPTTAASSRLSPLPHQNYRPRLPAPIEHPGPTAVRQGCQRVQSQHVDHQGGILPNSASLKRCTPKTTPKHHVPAPRLKQNNTPLFTLNATAVRPAHKQHINNNQRARV